MNRTAEKFWQALLTLFHDKQIRSLFARLMIISLILFAVYYTVEKRSERKKQLEHQVNASVYNPGSTGSMALREFIESMGLKTEKILRPLVKFLPSSDGTSRQIPGTVLILEPEIPLTHKDLEALSNRAQEGFHFIITSSEEQKMAELLRRNLTSKFKISAKAEFLKEVKLERTSITHDPRGLMKGVKWIFLKSRRRFVKWGSPWQVLLQDTEGTLALIKPSGRGSIVLISDALFLSNHYIRREDNGLFIYRLLLSLSPGGTVYFDEYHHGFSQSYTLLYFLARKEYSYILLQIVLFLVLLTLPAGIRFGQYRREKKHVDERIYYYSQAMSGMLEKAPFRDDVTKLMVENFRRMVNLHSDSGAKQKLKMIETILKRGDGKRAKRAVTGRIFRIIRDKGEP